MRLPELLAPVGSWEAMVAAVQNGADAVYLGGKMFSARQYANNFDNEELTKAVEFCHTRGVRVFITVNTLLTQNELPEALRYIKFLYEIGVDAVILQDLGVIRMIRELLPNLEIHASTQMTIHNASGAKFLADRGFNRVVLARETSLAEISQIRAEVPVELEVFVHGALCFSYSGQCLMSSLIGGRSGNRGRCAQPCRLKYELVDRDKGSVARELVGEHLISPKDLWTLPHIPDLIKAGVSSLKIEGRMKKPEYVATVVRIYRQALDRYKANPSDFRVEPQEEKEIRQIFNRDFTSGYFYGNPGADLISYARPNNRGLKLGRITGFDPKTKENFILLEESLSQGDGIEIWVTQGGRVGVVVHHIKVNGREVEEAQAGTTVSLEIPGKIRTGDRVFKTLDAKLAAQARESFTSPRELKKIPLDFQVEAGIGQPLLLTIRDPEGNKVKTATKFIGEEALKRPLDYEAVHKQMDRLGNTPFSIGELKVNIMGNVMVPMSEINEARRDAIEKLMAKRAGTGKVEAVNEREFEKGLKALLKTEADRFTESEGLQEKTGGRRQGAVNQEPGVRLTVAVGDLKALEAGVKAGADIIYFGSEKFTSRRPLSDEEIEQAQEICGKGGAKLVLTTPRILEQSKMKGYLPILDKVLAAAPDGIMAANPGLLQELLKRDAGPLYADFPLNVFNAQAVAFLEGEGCQQVTLSPELTMVQIGQLAGLTTMSLECLVHGSLPMMVSQHCITGSTLGEKGGKQCKEVCGSFRGGLKDRLKMVFPLAHDEYCHQYIFNPKELCMIEDLPAIIGAGIENLRIEARKEQADYVRKVVGHYRRELDRYLANPGRYEFRPEVKEELEKLSPSGLTKGHYYRGVE